MNYFSFSFLQNELNLSCIILLLLLSAPLLRKWYKASTRYYMWLIPTIALILPYHIPYEHALWQINATSIIKDISRAKEAPTKLIDAPNTPNQLLDENPIQLDFVEAHSPLHSPADTALTDTNPANMNSTGKHSMFKTNIPLSYYLIFIWLIGIVISGCTIILSHFKFIHYSRKWYKPIEDPKLQHIIQTLQLKYQLNSKVKINYCKLINTPITIGILHPIILLPTTPFDETELTMLLSHEMIHCIRKDIWYKALINLVQVIHWYNPLVYLMKKQIYFECEVSCDEKVLQGADESARLQYGEMIIDIVRCQSLKASTLSSAFFMEKRKLKERLSGIMDNDLKRGGKLMIMFLALLATSSNLLFGITNGPLSSPKAPVAIQKSQDSAALQVLNLNGGIASHLTQIIGTLSMKSGEAVTYSLQNNITDPTGKALSENLTISFTGSQNAFSKIQLNNQNPTATFIASADSDYTMLLQNDTDKLLNYSLKCTSTSDQPIQQGANTQPMPSSTQTPSTNTSSSSAQTIHPPISQNTSTDTETISKLINDPSSVSQAVLDKAFIDYIGKTNDIGMLFNVINSLSQNATDQIMISYIQKTSDIGMIFSAMDHLSQSAIDQIAKNYAQTHNDPGMIETLKPYVSAGVLNTSSNKGVQSD